MNIFMYMKHEVKLEQTTREKVMHIFLMRSDGSVAVILSEWKGWKKNMLCGAHGMAAKTDRAFNSIRLD